MDFAPHLRTIFAVRGAGAVYSPAVGAPVSLKAIRIGGGQAVNIGPVTTYLDDLAFDVLAADVPSPAAGAVLLTGGTSYSVESASRPPKDGDALLWRLNCRWGAPIVFRAATGTGATLSPPSITGTPYVSSAASAGAVSVTIKAGYAVGRIVAGDKLTIAGDSTVYTVTAPVSAVSNTFTNVPISPALAMPAALNAAVTATYAADYDVRAAVAGYEASQLQGGVLVGDRRVVILQSTLAAAGFSGAPQATHMIIMEGRSFAVKSANAFYEGEAPKVWEIQTR